METRTSSLEKPVEWKQWVGPAEYPRRSHARCHRHLPRLQPGIPSQPAAKGVAVSGVLDGGAEVAI